MRQHWFLKSKLFLCEPFSLNTQVHIHKSITQLAKFRVLHFKLWNIFCQNIALLCLVPQIVVRFTS